MRPIRFMVVAPGHFHAALPFLRPIAGVHQRVHTYAPLDRDTLTFLTTIANFDESTHWQIDLRAGENYRGRFLQEQPGNTVIFAGRNRDKLDLIQASVRENLQILADKPWIIEPSQFPALEQLFREAELREVILWDMMTERWEVATQLQRELMQDPDIFGQLLAGLPESPSVVLESVHHLKKTVAGRPLLRPAWWFDVNVAGDAIADVGTHLADLAMWLSFPEQPIDFRQDIRVYDASIWPTFLSREQFSVITGLDDYPPELDPYRAGDQLLYSGNGSVSWMLKGAHVRLMVQWDYESASGSGDTFESTVQGSLARIENRTVARAHQHSEQELSIIPNQAAHYSRIFSAVKHLCEDLQQRFPGIDARDEGSRITLEIPAPLRTSHESHFGSVVTEFQRYFQHPRLLPYWERSNLLAKYALTTQAVAMARARKYHHR